MAEILSYPRQDAYKTSLATGINTTDLSMTVATAPDFTLSSGTLYATIDPGLSTQETVPVTAISSAVFTITRAAPLFEGATSTAFAHSGGASVVISNNWNYFDDIRVAVDSKLNLAGDTITGDIDFTADSATTTFRLPNMTTTARDNIGSPANGMKIYNTTDGTEQVRDGGSWLNVETGTPVLNGSATVAGIYEEGTVAEQGTATATGGTGARLVVAVANLIKTSSGAGDENKLLVLDSAGQIGDSGFYDGNLTAIVSTGTTGITATELETLSDASEASTLHHHDPEDNSFRSSRVHILDHFGNAGTLGGTGTVGNNGGYVTITTNNINNNYGFTELTLNEFYTDISGNNPKWIARIKIDQTTNQDGIFGLGPLATAQNNNTLTTDHAAFLVADAVLIASVADGATQSTSAALEATYPITTAHEYHIRPSGSNFEFFIDGVSVFTSSTNNPNSGISRPNCSMLTAAAEAKTFHVMQHSVSFDET